MTTSLPHADIIFAVLDGRAPDEGVCVELGLAYANGKRCYGFKSDALIEQLQNYLETTPL